MLLEVNGPAVLLDTHVLVWWMFDPARLTRSDRALLSRLEEAGEAVTLDTIRQAYRRLLDAYFGPDFTIDPQLELECLRIPHFYSAFYVYKYSTGLSAAVALSQQVLTSGDATKYLGFLKSGGSLFPIPTLREAGVDMSKPKPVEDTLALFARRVDELEQLLG